MIASERDPETSRHPTRRTDVDAVLDDSGAGPTVVTGEAGSGRRPHLRLWRQAEARQLRRIHSDQSGGTVRTAAFSVPIAASEIRLTPRSALIVQPSLYRFIMA